MPGFEKLRTLSPRHPSAGVLKDLMGHCRCITFVAAMSGAPALPSAAEQAEQSGGVLVSYGRLQQADTVAHKTHLVLLALDQRLQVGIGVIVCRPALPLPLCIVPLDALLLAACNRIHMFQKQACKDTMSSVVQRSRLPSASYR